MDQHGAMPQGGKSNLVHWSTGSEAGCGQFPRLSVGAAMANELAAKLERQRLAADTGVAPAPRVSKGGPLNVYTEFPEFTRKQVMCLSSSSPLRRSVGLRPLGQCLLAVIMPQVARGDVAMLTSPSARFTFSHGDARHFEFGVWRRAHTSQASSLEHPLFVLMLTQHNRRKGVVPSC